MSGVIGVDALRSSLAAYDKSVKELVEAKIPQLARDLQAEMVANTPIGTSGRRGYHLRDLLAEEQAVAVKTTKTGVTAEVGFVTRDLQKRGFYAMWVERGRKAYAKGDYRRAGKDKRGKQREQKIKRNIGAMAPRLFMQMAFLRFRDRMKSERALAGIMAAAKSVAGGK